MKKPKQHEPFLLQENEKAKNKNTTNIPKQEWLVAIELRV